MKVDKRPLKVVDIPTPTRLHHKAYLCWNSMFRRCYNEKWLASRPSYIMAEVCDDWLKFSVFLLWYQEHYKDGRHLDKDLLSVEKLYSPETCIFIPRNLNAFLTKRAGSGVSKKGLKYYVQISMVELDKIHYSNAFDAFEEARSYYIKQKCEYGRQLCKIYSLSEEIENAVVKFVYNNF